MGKRDDNEQRLVNAIEVAAREFQTVADELRTIAADLPRRARPYGEHLEAVARRLDGVAGQLGAEVMLRPDPGFVRGLLASGRVALGLALFAGGTIAGGGFEEVGANIVDQVTEAVFPAQAAADKVDSAIQITLDAPIEPDTTDERVVSDWSDPASATTSPLGYSGTQTAKIVGISYQQLDYWARTDLIRPSLRVTGDGPGRLYSYNDLLELKAIKKLLDAGLKLEQVRKVFTYLREHVVADVSSAHIVIDGGSVMIVDADQLVGVLENSAGTTINVLSLGGVRDELEANLASLTAHDENDGTGTD